MGSRSKPVAAGGRQPNDTADVTHPNRPVIYILNLFIYLSTVVRALNFLVVIVSLLVALAAPPNTTTTPFIMRGRQPTTVQAGPPTPAAGAEPRAHPRRPPTFLLYPPPGR
ncbi:hypothetical protein FRC12_006395 [Ceratobasidium sp. 428]|nr:hypothetical protein FRC12_006395 [Ceratobasidium sp. 428]